MKTHDIDAAYSSLADALKAESDSVGDANMLFEDFGYLPPYDLEAAEHAHITAVAYHQACLGVWRALKAWPNKSIREYAFRAESVKAELAYREKICGVYKCALKARKGEEKAVIRLMQLLGETEEVVKSQIKSFLAQGHSPSELFWVAHVAREIQQSSRPLLVFNRSRLRTVGGAFFWLIKNRWFLYRWSAIQKKRKHQQT